MAKKKPRPKPTPAELTMLQVLWQRGPSSAREVHEEVGGSTGYTTTLKILQKMAAKGLVNRDETKRTHIYRSAIKAEKTQRDLIRDLLHSAFSGRTGKLVIQALSDRRASAEELAEIRQLLNELEAETSGAPEPNERPNP